MTLFDFFKKSSTTESELSAQFKKIQERKATLEIKAVELKRSALVEGAENLSVRLTELRDEAELLEAAEKEIEHRLRDLLGAKIEAEFLKVPPEREALAEREAAAVVRAGEALGEAAGLLLSFGVPWTNLLGQEVVEAVKAATGWNGYPESFQSAYSSGRAGASAENFKGNREKLQIIERRAPGSVEAGKFIDARVKVLLYKPTAPVPFQPAPPKLPGRGRIEGRESSQI